MKKLLFIGAILLASFLDISAQESLAGRVYYCGNLIEAEMKDMKKEVAQANKEAKTDEEKEEVKGIDALINAIVSKMTVKFIDDKTLEISSEAKFDEEKAKKGGASWLMRKMVKMKIGKGKSMKGQSNYTRNGRTITVTNSKKKEQRNFELSEDGKKLTFATKKKTFVLNRIK